MAKQDRRKETGEAILTKYGVEREELQKARAKGRLQDPELIDALELLEDVDPEPRGETAAG